MKNPLDRKLASILKPLIRGVPVGAKREKVERDWHKVRDRISDDSTLGVLGAVWKSLSPLPEKRIQPLADEVCGTVQSLWQGGFVDSAALLFVTWVPVITSLKVDQVLRVAPTLTALKAWCRGSKISKKEMEQQLLANIALAYENPGGDWLLANSKPDKLISLIDRLLARQPRPQYLPSWREALASAVMKDTRGAMLACILRSSSATEDQLAALAEAILSFKPALRTFAEVIPTLIAKEATARKAIDITALIFSDAAALEGDERQFRTVTMARIGTGVLLLNRQDWETKAILDTMADSVRRLRAMKSKPILQAKTWVLENLLQASPQPEAGPPSTSEWVRHLGSAFESAAQGFNAAEILTTMAQNLGLASLGTEGEVVSFDPMRHEDLDGGMLPGDPALIQETGWAHEKDIAIRAKVRKARGADNV